jgi:hypothetical protein
MVVLLSSSAGCVLVYGDKKQDGDAFIAVGVWTTSRTVADIERMDADEQIVLKVR